jgi:hypothetical protein
MHAEWDIDVSLSPAELWELGDTTTTAQRRHLASLGLRVRPFGALLAGLREVAGRCQRERSLAAAECACIYSRLAWGVFFNAFGRYAKPPPPALVRSFQAALRASIAGLDRCIRVSARSGADRQTAKLQQYRDNVAFRLDCLRIHHARGVDAVLERIRARTASGQNPALAQAA